MFCRAIWSSPFGTCAICRNHYCPFHRGFNVSCYSMGFILLSAFLLLNQFQASLIISNVESNLVKSTLPLHLLANFRLSTVPNPEIPSWNTSFFGSFPFSITMIHHIFWGFSWRDCCCFIPRTTICMTAARLGCAQNLTFLHDLQRSICDSGKKEDKSSLDAALRGALFP